jgi:hypothetical protein
MQRPNSSSGRKKAGTKVSTTKSSIAKKKLTANTKKALELKRRSASKHTPKNLPTGKAGRGMRPIPNEENAPSGALKQEGHRPVLERSRKVR